MAQSILRFTRRSAEFIEKKNVTRLKRGLRGIYVLYQRRIEAGREQFDLRYIGMSAGIRLGIKRRLQSHIKSKRKGDQWTHFSVFEVWDNVTDQEIAELEGLARHLYRKDPTANTLNIQRGYKNLRKVRNDKIGNWT